jgi:decaprenylphospho-beta-D-ribofuranose 2-oxidase
VDLKLMTADSGVLTCSPDENTEVFWATVGGMGLTGVILSARLRLQPVRSAYVRVDYQKTPDLDGVLEQLRRGEDRYTYSVAWIDCLASGKALGRSVLMQAEHAGPDDLPPGKGRSPLQLPASKSRCIPFDFPGWALNPMSIGCFNAVFYRRHADRGALVDCRSYFCPLDGISQWNRMYGRRGFIQYQAVLPTESSHRGLVRLLEKLTQARAASFLGVLKTMGPAGPGLLSFPMRGHTLALDIPMRPGVVDLARQLDRIVLDHGGRVYLAKDACMSAESFRAMYPNLDRFKQVKLRVDPRQRFASAQALRLGLVEDAR